MSSGTPRTRPTPPRPAPAPAGARHVRTPVGAVRPAPTGGCRPRPGARPGCVGPGGFRCPRAVGVGPAWALVPVAPARGFVVGGCGRRPWCSFLGAVAPPRASAPVGCGPGLHALSASDAPTRRAAAKSPLFPAAAGRRSSCPPQSRPRAAHLAPVTGASVVRLPRPRAAPHRLSAGRERPPACRPAGDPQARPGGTPRLRRRPCSGRRGHPTFAAPPPPSRGALEHPGVSG